MTWTQLEMQVHYLVIYGKDCIIWMWAPFNDGIRRGQSATAALSVSAVQQAKSHNSVPRFDLEVRWLIDSHKVDNLHEASVV